MWLGEFLSPHHQPCVVSLVSDTPRRTDLEMFLHFARCSLSFSEDHGIVAACSGVRALRCNASRPHACGRIESQSFGKSLNDTTQPRGTVYVQFLGRQEVQSTHRSEFPSHSPWEASGTSAVRSRVAAHWSSWADCIKMVRETPHFG